MSAAELPPSSGSRIKGSEAVKTALIKAAAEMLGEVGPKSLSVRDLAERAGVNHGQVHHYFGGKRGLLEAAMRHLAKLHFDRSLELSGGGAVPPPLSLTEDRAYFRALCQSVMDDDIELVMTVDRDDEISVPLRVLRHLRETHPESNDLDIRARFAALAAMQLGWFAFEELMMLTSEVAPAEEDDFRERVKSFMQRVIDLGFD
ncbi:MAG TPA: TetR/AcrR family transcriptional regulator [Myxococcales bacterium]|nr:TetR/AcrR family transcriptional regulator [Myxococcales bacterium]HIK84821.1 TetR/AcrR family transcriptional regulator [Myxococcales bacterium]